jgi:subtilisin-like proprotein convertase family protein
MSSMVICTVLAATSLVHAQQPTDECGVSAPVLVVGTPLNGTTFGAGSSFTLTDSLCGRFQGSGGFFDVFARFTPPTSGVYRFTTCASTTDTVVSVHTGCPAVDANIVDCGDDDEDCSAFSASTVTVRLQASIEYHVRIATPFYSDPGAFDIMVSSITAPANDECAGAVSVALGGTASGTNVNASGSNLAGAGCQLNNNGDGSDVWYSFAVASAGVYTIEVDATNFKDLVITLQDGCPGNQLACNDNDFLSNKPRIDKFLTAGVYHVRVAGSRGNTGRPAEDAFTLSVSNPSPLLPNDTCDTATVISASSSTNGTTVGSTNDGNLTSSCHSLDHRDVWYALTVPSVAEYFLNVTSTGGNWNPAMTLYASCGGAEEVCTGTELRRTLNPSTTYLVRVAGDFDGQGSFTLSVDAGTPIPLNDTCGAPAVANVGATSGTNAGSSGTDITPSCAYDDSRDVWYSFTAPSAGFYNFEVTGSPELSDTSISIFDSCSSDVVVCNDNITGRGSSPNMLSRVGLEMTAGHQVLVRVAGVGSSFGSFTLNIAGPSAAPAIPSNDTFENARVITTDTFTETIDARRATTDIGHTCVNDDLPYSSYGVWYKYTAADHGVLTFTDNGSVDRAVTSFFSFDGGSPILDLPLQCDEVTIEVQPGETHYFLVSSRNLEQPAGSFEVSFNYKPELGCCQRPNVCALERQSTCTGTWTASLCGPSVTHAASVPTPITIPNPATNNNPVYVNSSINVADTNVLSNVSVTVGLQHSSAGHVVMRLITPWGATIQLLDGQHGISTFNGTYTFSDIGLRNILDLGAHQSPLPSTTYPADVTIGPVVAGRVATGTWTLAVGDDTRTGATGKLNSWSLTLNGTCGSTCAGDFDGSGTRTIDDIFIFLNAWFAGDPRTDVDGNGRNIDDIFIFLNVWFAGC